MQPDNVVVEIPGNNTVPERAAEVCLDTLILLRESVFLRVGLQAKSAMTFLLN